MALDMVRPGLTLYGYGDETGRLGLKPAMRLVTTVSTIKIYDPGTYVSYGRKFRTERVTRMGVVGIGYADGLFRTVSNKCSFWTPSGFAPQRGSICMDMCMIDLTDLPKVNVGSEVEVFGAPRGRERAGRGGGHHILRISVQRFQARPQNIQGLKFFRRVSKGFSAVHV
jgi:alanine racemase